MATTSNTTSTTASATMSLDDLAAQLSRAHGERLTAVVLYGSAARGEQVAQRSDLNVLVIVKSLGAAALRESAATSRAWAEAGNPPPLVLTEAEWRSSRDIFAMEFADILDRHRVITGALPDVRATVDPAHLRHQLEFEAMGKLIHLRQAILACEGDAARELELLAATKSAVLVLFRTLVRAHGERPPEGAEAVVRRAAALAGLDPTPFLEVVTHVAGAAAIPTSRAHAVLDAYHSGLERFVAHVDALVHSP
jgi:predicted nucleotidyltransferase